jgi:GntR family histidine utilization transcriptional repressor
MNHIKPIPLYERIKIYLLERIQSGEWADGAKIPSEYELMDIFSASRMTVHRALREMQADGLLRRAQGVGSFVQGQKPRSALLEITDIADDILSRGNVHRAEMVVLESVRADSSLAAAFELRKGAKIFHSVIVHFENDVPVQLEERFVTPRFAPDYGAQDFEQRTTASYLQSMGRAVQVEHVIHAVAPAPLTQSLLRIAADEPCLELTRRTWTQAGPATKSVLTHPGSRYSLGSRYETQGSKNPG